MDRAKQLIKALVSRNQEHLDGMLAVYGADSITVRFGREIYGKYSKDGSYYVNFRLRDIENCLRLEREVQPFDIEVGRGGKQELIYSALGRVDKIAAPAVVKQEGRGGESFDTFAEELIRGRTLSQQRNWGYALGYVANPMRWWDGLGQLSLGVVTRLRNFIKDQVRPFLGEYTHHEALGQDILKQGMRLSKVFGVERLSQSMVKEQMLSRSSLIKEFIRDPRGRSLTGYWNRETFALPNVGNTGRGWYIDRYKDGSQVSREGSEVMLIRDQGSGAVLGEIGYDAVRGKTRLEWNYDNINRYVGTSVFKQQLQGFNSRSMDTFLERYSEVQPQLERICPEMYRTLGSAETFTVGDINAYDGREVDFRGEYLKSLCEIGFKNARGFGEFMNYLPNNHQRQMKTILASVLENQSTGLFKLMGDNYYEMDIPNLGKYWVERDRNILRIGRLNQQNQAETLFYCSGFPPQLSQLHKGKEDINIYSILLEVATSVAAHTTLILKQMEQLPKSRELSQLHQDVSNNYNLFQEVFVKGNLVALGDEVLKRLGLSNDSAMKSRSVPITEYNGSVIEDPRQQVTTNANNNVNDVKSAPKREEKSRDFVVVSQEEHQQEQKQDEQKQRRIRRDWNSGFDFL